MRLMFLIVVVTIKLFGSEIHHDDPRFCGYWIERLGQVAALEQLRIDDVKAIEGTEMAVELDIEFREQIRALIGEMTGVRGKWGWY